MRLWHKDLIAVLPRQQLFGQWRECCAIMQSIKNNGTPNHMLVNKIIDYPIEEFNEYAERIRDEIIERGHQCYFGNFSKWQTKTNIERINGEIFKGWHNNRYLLQCFYNLQEKYDCGGVPEEEWKRLCIKVKELWE